MDKDDTKLLLYSFAFIAFMACLGTGTGVYSIVGILFAPVFIVVFAIALLISILFVRDVFVFFIGIICEDIDRIYKKYPLIKKALVKLYNILSYIFSYVFLFIIAIMLLCIFVLPIIEALFIK